MNKNHDFGKIVRTKEQIKFNEFICKSSQSLHVNTYYLRGNLSIVKVRKYERKIEVDVVFRGNCLFGINKKLEWCGSDVQNQPPLISGIILKRFFRSHLFALLKNHLEFFSEELIFFSHIKNITWI
jgi:hypothetical protein